MTPGQAALVDADIPPLAAEGDYDAFAVFDSVPGIVRELDKSESRFLSLLSAFIGVGSVFIGGRKHPLETL